MAFEWKTAVVVGASSGIGAELARQLGARGCKVALVARREAELAAVAAEIEERNRSGGGERRAWVYAHDVTQTDDVPALFQQICRDLGGLDLFIYASGVLPQVAEDEYSIEKDRAMIEVNLLGAVVWCNEAARRFAAAEAGTLVGIGSVAGDRGRRTMAPLYSATKAALDTYLEALRCRLARHGGVRVVTIKPGPVATAMTQGRGSAPFIIPASEAAREILRAAERGDAVAYVPWKWKPIMAVLRAIPGPLFRKIGI